MNETLLYKIGITLIPKVGPKIGKNLISYCGGVEAVFKTPKKQLLKIPGIGPEIANAISSPDIPALAEKEMEYIRKNNIQVLFYLDADFPSRLRHINDSPLLLYYKGNANLNSERTVAIVGTRKPTPYGLQVCRDLVGGLGDYNILLISGLAYGIDVCAHRSCLQFGIPTLGIVGHGLDTIYPPVHRGVASSMIQNGGLLTEFSSNTLPDGRHFPMRNRIIAGLADAVIVVETGKSGGSIITANIAHSYNKDVFAVPGRTSDKQSEGCNHLIKCHKAALIQNASDIGYIMNWEKPEMGKTNQRELFVELDESEQLILSLFKNQEGLDIDYLSYKTQMRNSEIASLVLNLEFKGVLKSLPGKRYVKV